MGGWAISTFRAQKTQVLQACNFSTVIRSEFEQLCIFFFSYFRRLILPSQCHSASRLWGGFLSWDVMRPLPLKLWVTFLKLSGRALFYLLCFFSVIFVRSEYFFLNVRDIKTNLASVILWPRQMPLGLFSWTSDVNKSVPPGDNHRTKDGGVKLKHFILLYF